MFTRRTGLLVSLLAFLASSISSYAQGKSYHLELPEYKANAGKPLTVPIILHEASGLAWVRVQVNFNSEVIQFDSVSSGPLGDQFDLEHELDGGTLTLDFTRAENLVSGSGHLARIKFTTNAGATTDLYSDLAIAKFEIGDESGVTDLTTENTIILENGSVHVSVEPDLDNEGNGLPDWWERAHALDPFTATPSDDLDGDSIVNKLELAFGGNPNAKDARSILPKGTFRTFNTETFLALEYRRRINEGDGLSFTLYESADLKTWEPLSIPSLKIDSTDIGDGMEMITVRGTRAMDGLNKKAKGFLKIEVE